MIIDKLVLNAKLAIIFKKGFAKLLDTAALNGLKLMENVRNVFMDIDLLKGDAYSAGNIKLVLIIRIQMMVVGILNVVKGALDPDFSKILKPQLSRMIKKIITVKIPQQMRIVLLF